MANFNKRSPQSFTEGDFLLACSATGFNLTFSGSILDQSTNLLIQGDSKFDEFGNHVTIFKVNDKTFSHIFGLTSSRTDLKFGSEMNQDLVAFLPGHLAANMGMGWDESAGFLGFDLKSYIRFEIDEEKTVLWEASLLEELGSGDYSLAIPILGNFEMGLKWDYEEKTASFESSCDKMGIQLNFRQTPGNKQIFGFVFNDKVNSPR